MANRSCYERVAMILNMFKNRHNLSNPCERGDWQRISYESFRRCDVAVALIAIRDTPFVRKPIRKCVRAVLNRFKEITDRIRIAM